MSETGQLAAGPDGGAEAMGALLERALQGDGAALGVLITLLKTQHYRRIIGSMRKVRCQANTATLEDVFQDSVIQLVERVKSGELRDLPEESRRDVLKVFQQLCDRKLQSVYKPRRSPVNDRRKGEVPESVVDGKVSIPGEGRPTEQHRNLLESALRRLDPFERQILVKYLDGQSYAEIARETGKSEAYLMNVVSRAKKDILFDILPRSATARLKYEKEETARFRTPSREELRAAVDQLPLELREAVVHVHYEKRDLGLLAQKLGPGGAQKAKTRIHQAYRTLSGRLKAPFPKTFDDIAP
jgi:RNA polymerase sigma factor (sigma-70 family)